MTPGNEKETSLSRALREGWKATTPAYQFIITILLVGLAGWWLDRKLGTDPWLLMLGLGAGFAIGIYNLVGEVGGKKGRR